MAGPFREDLRGLKVADGFDVVGNTQKCACQASLRFSELSKCQRLATGKMPEDSEALQNQVRHIENTLWKSTSSQGRAAILFTCRTGLPGLMICLHRSSWPPL